LSISRREISRGRLARQARIIKIPLLLVAGEEDQIVDPQAVGAWAHSVDQAEVCLFDECGHLPMIERTAEFNAQVLAFLTGDTRYLDYVEAPSEAVEDIEDVEETERDHIARDGEASQSATPPNEPSDLPPHFPSSDDSEPERHEEKPNIFRKREGSYSDMGNEPERPGTSLGDGIEGDEGPRPRPRRTPPGEDMIPQLPDDLFDWPEARDESRSHERPRAVFPEERGDDEPEEPSRS
jgi:hypothetical protein